MRIHIFDTYDEVSKYAGLVITSQVIQNPRSIIGLATGSTPIGTYKALVEMYNQGLISFRDIKTFNLDEYCGLKKDNPQSYNYYMNEHFFNHVDVKEGNHHIPNGNAADFEEEARRYEKMIIAHGGIDLQLLGIGHNGHLGFNEPNLKFEASTHVVDLAEETIEANSRFFDSIDEVPKQAISMGIKSIMQSKMILLVATGEDKADAVYGAIHGKIITEMPASILQLHPNVTVVLDEGAASKLLDTP